MKNDWTFADYEVVKDNKIKLWIPFFSIFIAVVGILWICFHFPFQFYEKFVLWKQDNRYFFIVESNQIGFIEHENTFYIQQKKYDYEVVAVDSNYTTLNQTIYQIIYVSPYTYQTDATTTECYFLRKKQTIIEMIIDLMKGEVK